MSKMGDFGREIIIMRGFFGVVPKCTFEVLS